MYIVNSQTFNWIYGWRIWLKFCLWIFFMILNINFWVVKSNFFCNNTLWLTLAQEGSHRSSGWMTGFDSRAVCMGFVVEKVTLGQVLLRVLRLSLVGIIPQLPHTYSFIHNWRFISLAIHSAITSHIHACIQARHAITHSGEYFCTNNQQMYTKFIYWTMSMKTSITKPEI